jgi:hydrogenase expression/formation protein HypE
MRDPTRGGVAAVLNELVAGRSIDVELDESSIPVSPGSRAVAELLGLDPLNVACEGRVLMVCRPDSVDRLLRAWRALPEGAHAERIGRVAAGSGRVVMETVTGGRRLVDCPRGELLPRIC